MASTINYNNRDSVLEELLKSGINVNQASGKMANNNALHGQIITDAAGIITGLNKAAAAITGYSINEFTGTSISLLFVLNKPFEPEWQKRLNLAATRPYHQTKTHLQKKDGTTFCAAIQYTTLFSGNDELSAVTISICPLYDNETQQLSRNNQTLNDGTRIKKLIENNFGGITLLDKDLKIIYRSDAGKRITGWGMAERKQNTLLELTHIADREMVTTTVNNALKQPGKAQNCSFRVKHFNGNYIWIECIFTDFLNDPEIEAIVCNFRDVTEKRHAEDLFEKTTNELLAYKYALDESAIVAITDQLGIIKHVNNNFCKISKYTANELIGHDHRIINSSYHDKAFICNLWHTIAHGKIWKGELKNKAKDGSFYWVDTTIVPFLNEKGKPYQYVAIRSDITERKLNQEKVIENELFIKTITDNLPAMIAYWSADLHCLFANKPYLDWFDKTPKEMLGINKKDLTSQEEFETYKPYINNVLSGKPQSFERIFYKHSGRKIFTHTQYLPDREGDIVKGFYSLIYDTSEIKLAEQQIKKKSEEIENLLESIGDAFFAIDKNWIVTYWNSMAEKVLLTRKSKIIGRNLWDVFKDSVGSFSHIKYLEALETHKPVHFQDYHPPLNRWYEISAYPADNGLTVYFKDITERKIGDLRLIELNDELKKHAKDLAISNAELEQFAYVASHDLQEPLRMVTSFLTQLEKKYEKVIDDKGKQYIHFAVDGAKRMRQIILDLLEFSRIGRTEDEMEELNLNKVINEIIALYRKKIEDENGVIMFQNLPTLHTYKTPVRQLLQNLISNALKYHKKGVPPVINITCKDSKDSWEIAVQDNGIGIDPEFFAKIFIIFHKLHPKNEYPGTGMGLAIAKKLVENLGGHIWVESQEGLGSTFYFTILKNIEP